MHTTTWRLIGDGPAHGAWNMAVDEATLDAYRAGEAPPTLRLYDWTPATLSLGYAQREDEVDREACLVRGVAIVRRPTGGRAVLHGAGDLTYAIVASEREGFDSSVALTYCRIAKAIALALADLGVAVGCEPGDQRPGTKSACFSTATRADLVVQGRKLAGSAQVRRHGGFLQHGTLLLAQEPGAIAPLLKRASDLEGATSLKQLGHGHLGWDEVARALVNRFAVEFGARFEPGSLSAAERKRAEAIATAR
jgi:lipoate-protein ligase A